MIKEGSFGGTEINKTVEAQLLKKTNKIFNYNDESISLCYLLCKFQEDILHYYQELMVEIYVFQSGS